MRQGWLLAVIALAAPASLYAQNDVGVWMDATRYGSTRFIELPSASSNAQIHAKTSYGLSFEHFQRPSISTELAWHRLHGDADVGFSSGTHVPLGSIRVDALSALVKWHFGSQSWIAPYVGAGAAYFVHGRVTPTEPIAGRNEVDIENKLGYVLAAGVSVPLSRSIAFAVDVRHSPFKAIETPLKAPGDFNLDPTTLALGLRFRM
jgi:outer membrane protein W